HRLYHLHILHYHFALCTFQTHTHTSTRSLSCTTHPHKHKNIIYFCTIHTSRPRSLSSWTRHCQNHCTLYNRVRPFPVSGNTLCEYVLPMCMYMCSPYVYVYVI